MRLIDPSGFDPQQYLDRRGVTHAQLRALAAPRHAVAPMRGGGVTLGSAAQVPPWRPRPSSLDQMAKITDIGLRAYDTYSSANARAMTARMNQAKLAADERQQQALGNIRSGLSGADAYAGSDFGPSGDVAAAGQAYRQSPEFVSDVLGLDTKAGLGLLTPKAPTMRTIYRGGKNIQQEWTGSGWTDVGSGLRWNPAAGGSTLAQQRENLEIDAARGRIRAQKFVPGETRGKTIGRFTKKTTDTGRENPAYNQYLDNDANRARRRMVGDDPGYAEFMTWFNQPAPPAPATTPPSSASTPRENAIPAWTPDPAIMEAHPETSSSARARNTVSRIGSTSEPRGSKRQLRGQMRKLGRGTGSKAQPFRPESDADFRVINIGEWFINPADGRHMRKTKK